MFEQANYSWWWFAGLFFAPDLSMVGYLINTKIGAICYNFAHHLGVAILVFLLGKHFNMIELEMAGSVLLAHSTFDRVLGYGLNITIVSRNPFGKNRERK